MNLNSLIDRTITDNTGKEFKFNNTQDAIYFLNTEINFWEETESEWRKANDSEPPRFFTAANYLKQMKSSAEEGNVTSNKASQINLPHYWIYSQHEFVPTYIDIAQKLTPEALKGFYMASANQNTETIPPQLILGMILGYEQLNSLSSISERITKSKSEFSSMMEESENTRKKYEQRFKDLEKKHTEFLTLKEPGKFWEDQAKTYQMQGWLWSLILGLAVTLGLIAASNFYIAWLSGSDLKIGLNTLHGVVILGVIVTFFGFACRILSKLALSSFHLMRDSQERKLLTYLYLSLNKENQLDQSSREIILQSLFSRSDSGLLSGDSSPTMPGGLNEIIKNLKNS